MESWCHCSCLLQAIQLDKDIDRDHQVLALKPSGGARARRATVAARSLCSFTDVRYVGHGYDWQTVKRESLMNNDMRAFESFSHGLEGEPTGWRARLNHLSWFLAAGLLAVVLLPVAAHSPDNARKIELLAKTQASEQASPWRAEERRLQEVIANVKARHVQFNRDQPFYSQTVVDETRDQMVRYIAQGVAPSEALARAVQDVERAGMPQLVLADE